MSNSSVSTQLITSCAVIAKTCVIQTTNTMKIMNSIAKITASAPVMFVGTLVLALSTISAATIVPSILEGQARKQCKLNDWPAESHAVHMEFCKAHNYPTS